MTSPITPAITIDGLSHTYRGTRKTAPRTAIDSLTLHVNEGDFAILSGPNGSGKTTLFRILSGMIRPSAGSIRVAGHDLLSSPAEARRHLGVVFQSPAVDKHLTVDENLRLHAALYGIGTRDFVTRRDEALAWSELKNRLNDRVIALSGGLARQVELAKCLLTRPTVLLLDEPTTGLDPASRRHFLDALRTLQQSRKMTVLMTTHIFSEAEDADQVAIMKTGHLLAYDTPQTLRAKLGREMVVAESRDAETLAARIGAELGLIAHKHGDEVRLQETAPGSSLPLLEKLLSRYRAEITSIAIKQPTLEDVFIHLTGAAETPPVKAEAAQ
ncbi:MAG TPA: ABC transporter ATP-binding protein [Magnetospirillaceae bacterium]|jgi:ABC-2 type transport system ATP-binding protein